MTISLLLLLGALVSFLLATFGVAAKVNLVALGLALLTLAQLVGGVAIAGVHG